MNVNITSSSGDTATWFLPKALLSHYSGYFLRASRVNTFVKGEESKVVIEGFEPDIFNLFIEFMYYGRYICRDNLRDPARIRDSAKAWVLGDYLDAVEFKNATMSSLYNMYFPDEPWEPITSIGPEIMEYCYSNSSSGSPLQRFYEYVAIKYWHREDLVSYSSSEDKSWDNIWYEHPKFRNRLLYSLNQCAHSRLKFIVPLKDLLEKRAITKQSQAHSNEI